MSIGARRPISGGTAIEADNAACGRSNSGGGPALELDGETLPSACPSVTAQAVCATFAASFASGQCGQVLPCGAAGCCS
jgi:hypothetical protein